MSNSYPSATYHEDEEEFECRVCRGPAEEGRPLFKPCKCSGSIAFIHQDCLQSWLEVKGGKGKCDLCVTSFQFAPKYAEDAPDYLSPYQVFTGLSMRFASKWLPYALRILFVCGVWLGILPLSTAYLYQGWMYRPKSISSRLSWDLFTGDLVNGGILTVIIILSFLSLMSLADFLRFQWKRDGDEEKEEDEMNETDDSKRLIEPDRFDRFDEEIDSDDGLFVKHNNEFERSIKRQTISVTDEGNPFIPENRNGSGIAASNETFLAPNHELNLNPEFALDDFDALTHDQLRELQRRGHYKGVRRQRSLDSCNRRILHVEDDGNRSEEESSSDENDIHDHLKETDDVDSESNSDDEDEEAMIERMMQLQEENMGAQGEEDDLEEEEVENHARHDPPEDERFEPRFEPLDRPFEDEPMDADMQVPLEQLVGLRGPLSEVFRNLCWLLAFLASFIALFALIPCAIGSFAFSHFVRSSILKSSGHFILKRILFSFFDLTSTEGEPMDLSFMVNITNVESESTNNLLKPEHGAKIAFGYLAMATLTFSVQAALKLYLKYRGNEVSVSTPSQNFQRDDVGMNHMDDIRMGLGVGRDPRERPDPDAMRPEEMQAYILKSVDAVVDCGAAISKICILVIFKMFTLPLLLGVWLDLCTLKLFGVTIEDRLHDAGANIFGFFLLHWVVGITFMLSVTVSVLQLREVLHPDLLAPMIRPQEQQTDVLASLLQENGWTHTKRMVPSVAIYAALLAIHVWLPCKAISSLGLEGYIPIFRPKFWYILNPSLQRTIELISFHLAALSILEKHKNRIGEMQHKFLLKISKAFGIMETLLPLSTSKFVHVGDLSLTQQTDDGGLFWDELMEVHKKRGATDFLIESKISLLLASSTAEKEFSEDPVVLPNSYINISSNSGRKLMPTRIGSFRFRKQVNRNFKSVIEVWREVVDEPIPRPPVGWDYLADGGAVEKGRWAWGKKEKKSSIEENVAERKAFFPPIFADGKFTEQWKTRYFFISGLPTVMKLSAVLMASWLGVSLGAAVILFGPLFLGRSVLHILKVPDDCIHDPFVFIIGGLILSPIISTVVKAAGSNKKDNEAENQNTTNISIPPIAKLSVLAQTLSLWLAICPLLAGGYYNLLFAGHGFALNLDVKTIINCWPVGFILLHIWGALCYHGAFHASFWREMRRLIIDSIAGGPAPGDDNDRGRIRQRQNRAFNRRAEIDEKGEVVELPYDDGGVNSFVEAVKAVLWEHEWDKIDRSTLLQNCAFPVAMNLLGLLIIPLLACCASDRILDSGEDISSANLFRWFALAVLVIKFAHTFQSPLKSWYKLGHQAARDHRYLVGEILLDYREPS